MGFDKKVSAGSLRNALFPEVFPLPKLEKLALLVTPDRLRAYLICLSGVFPPQCSARTVIERIHELGVESNISIEAVQSFTDRCNRGQRPLPTKVIEGTAPGCEKHGGWVFPFPDIEKAGGMEQLPNYFKQGEVVAKRISSGEAKEGVDIWGKKLPPFPSELPQVAEGLKLEGDSVIAQKDGYLMKDSSGTLFLIEKAELPGTVLLVYSPLRLCTDATFRGSIPPRSILAVQGDLTVIGSVYRGAKITAKGNVLVTGRIERALTKAGGSITVSCCSKATLKAAGDVLVKRSLSEGSHVSTSGFFRTQDNAALTDSTVEALKGIDVWDCGSKERGKCVLSVGITLEVERKLAKLDKKIKELSEQREKVYEAFSLSYGHLEGKSSLKKASKEERERFFREKSSVSKKLEQLDREISALRGKQNQLTSRRRRCDDAVIKVRNRLWPVAHCWIRKKLLVQSTPLDGPLIIQEGSDHRLHIKSEVPLEKSS